MEMKFFHSPVISNKQGTCPILWGPKGRHLKLGRWMVENLGELLETDHQRIDGGFLKWGIPKTIAFKWFQY